MACYRTCLPNRSEGEALFSPPLLCTVDVE
jgi:hypothetical protein